MRASLPDYYDDPSYDYRKYWENRQYENESEKKALNHLFRSIPQKGIIADIGGGFGRLSPSYAPIFNECFLLDPSKQMLEQAKKYCYKFRNIKLDQGCVEKIPLPDNSVDTALIVRTLHHCKDINAAFGEVYRILKVGGFIILEFPNTAHLKNILRSILQGHKELLKNPRQNIATKKEVPFFNYHPEYIKKTLQKNHFSIIKTLSVSNLRGYYFKKYIPLKYLLKMEAILQPIFARFYFGPSIFILAKKTSEK